jgi:hypothetical protein
MSEPHRKGLFIRALTLAAALCVVLLPAVHALAQSGGAILGTITDAQSLALPGVELTLRNVESGLTRSSVSEGNGTYRFLGVPPGTYDLKAVLDGFGVSELKGQTITVGLEVKHDFVMKIQSLQETLTVTAQVPVIEATKSEVSGVVTQQQIESVPVPTRQTLDLALLLPGTNTDGSVPRRVSVSVGAGGAVSQNAFLVDGVSNSQSTGGDPRQDFPQGGIREFRVNVSQASAEFGGTTGGVVSIVTKSGTNRFSGDAFEFFRDKSLNAMNEFEQLNHDTTGAPKPAFRQNQAGFTLGGPIVMDKAHFLVATDATQTDQSIIVNTGKPQDYASVEGAYPNNQYRRMFFVRSDVQISPSQTFFARWGWERDILTCQSCGGTAASTSGSLVQQRRNSFVAGHDCIVESRPQRDPLPMGAVRVPEQPIGSQQRLDRGRQLRALALRANDAGLHLSELDLRYDRQQGADRDVVGISRRLLYHDEQRWQSQLEDGRRVHTRAEHRGPDRQSARHVDIQHRSAVQSQQPRDGRGVE